MSDRRIEFLQGRITALEASIAALKAEDVALDSRKSNLNRLHRNLWQDKLWSAVVHRQSRIPILIQHAEREIEQFRVDLERYRTFH
ncbi:hypothetical protein [Lichenibacterium dinghuense]|uniref:hypothetical protein n=1 Tax=Lichenibacterium dinghuense TaxID=2895977 RepID=UPI001F455101|nr:hypothetical protein [Lichenibacterium sp. 6Y81]